MIQRRFPWARWVSGLVLLLAACGGADEPRAGDAAGNGAAGSREPSLGPGVTVDTQVIEDSSALVYLPSDSAAAP